MHKIVENIIFYYTSHTFFYINFIAIKILFPVSFNLSEKNYSPVNSTLITFFVVFFKFISSSNAHMKIWIMHKIVYTYWLGMRVIALLLPPRYQLFSKVMQRKIVGTEGTIKVLLPEYQVYKCFIILNNCRFKF
jgi:hypothetical protein